MTTTDTAPPTEQPQTCPSWCNAHHHLRPGLDEADAATHLVFRELAIGTTDDSDTDGAGEGDVLLGLAKRPGDAEPRTSLTVNGRAEVYMSLAEMEYLAAEMLAVTRRARAGQPLLDIAMRLSPERRVTLLNAALDLEQEQEQDGLS